MYEQLRGIYWLFTYFLLAPTLSISPSAAHLPLSPHVHTLWSCVVAAVTLQSVFPRIHWQVVPLGSAKGCHRGKLKMKHGGRVFIPVFRLLSQYFSCRQLSLLTSFFCTQQQLCYTSETPAADQLPPWQSENSQTLLSHPQGHFLPQKSKHQVCGGSLPIEI